MPSSGLSLVLHPTTKSEKSLENLTVKFGTPNKNNKGTDDDNVDTTDDDDDETESESDDTDDAYISGN